jgi:hypothetical protein
MINVVKMTILIFLMTLIVQVQGKSLLDELPKDVSTLSAKEHAKILNRIAVFSYQTLLEVPAQGLSAKHVAIEEVVSLRQWAETRQQPLFHLLALQLQRAVDMAIFNEIWRENQTRVGGFKVYTPFKTGSFDKPLLKSLLQLNELAERQLIKKALNFEGKITNFLRQENYPLEYYLSGGIFEMMPENFARAITESWPLGGKLSKSSLGDELLIKTLQSIDEASSVRIAVKVYLDNGGFPPMPEKVVNLFSKPFTKLIKRELQKTPKERISKGTLIFGRNVLWTMRRYAEYEPSRYSIGLTLFLYSFFLEENKKLLPKEAMEFAKREKFEPGQWLTFKE